MKKLCLISLCLTFTTISSAENWQKIAKNKEIATYIDTDSIQKTTNNYVLFTAKYIYPKSLMTKDHKNYNSEIYQYKADCENHSLSVIFETNYSKTGKVVYSQKSQQDNWEFIMPTSMKDLVFVKACQSVGFQL